MLESHPPKNMPLPAKFDYNPCRFKSHDKTVKRDMTVVEALERDTTREKGYKFQGVRIAAEGSVLQLCLCFVASVGNEYD